MAKSLSELSLKDEALPTQNLDELPEFGGFTPPPQPGPYRFKLPNMEKVWDVFDTQKGQRVRAVFDRDNPLLIIGSPGGRNNNETFQTRLSNAERKRGKDGPEVSDLDYLLKAFGEKQRPTGNRGYIEKLKTASGKEFGGDITYSYACNDQRNIRTADQSGKLIEVEGQKGCGKKYYQRDVENLKQNGEFPHEINCTCGAVLRAFANLDNIRA